MIECGIFHGVTWSSINRSYLYTISSIFYQIQPKFYIVVTDRVDVAPDSSDDKGTLATLIDSVSDETLGLLVRHASDLTSIQNSGRVFVQRFLQRNAIFTGKVQANSRVTIPATEVEKLDLEQGDLVQIVLTPIEELPDGVADDSEEDQ